MTLNLLLDSRPWEGNAVIFAHPSAVSFEPVLAALGAHLDVHRVMFPLPSETTRHHVPPPSLLRQRHAELWHALPADERARTLLAAGPTAAYLAPVVGPGATTLVAVPEPGAMTSDAWRAVLGPFPDLDEIPEEAGSVQERDRWLDRIRTATGGLDLVRVGQASGIAVELAAALGLGPKQAARTARVAAAGDADAGSFRGRNRRPHWIGEALYSLSRPVRERPPRRHRPVTS